MNKPESKIDIFIDGSEESNQFGHRLDYNKSWVTVSSVDHVEELLSNLKNGTKVSFWIHVGNMSESTKDTEPLGRVIMKRFVSKFGKLHFEFLTRAGNPQQGLEDKKVYRTGDLEEISKKGEIPYYTVPIKFDVQLKSKNYSLKDENDLDSRIFEKYIGENTLKKIVGELLDKTHKNVQVSVLEPGFSGAFVLLFEFEEQNDNVKWVIKINESIALVDTERSASSNISEYLKSTKSFVTSITNKSKRIENWSCLVFQFLEEEEPFRKFMKENLISSSKERIKSLCKNLFNDFAGLRKGITLTSGRLWKGISDGKSNQGFKLELGIAKKIEFSKFLKDTSVLLKTILLDKEIVIDILEFVEKNTFKSKSIEPTDQSIYLSRVHGDFHSGNIFINTKEDSFSFIDLSHFTQEPCKSSFLDVGKLSVDIELTVTNNLDFFQTKDLIEDLSNTHEKWLNEKDITGNRFENIFIMNEQLFNFQKNELVSQFSDKIDDEEVWRQFLLVRLHYLIKHCTYVNITFEKKIYSVKIMHQILKYLTNQ